MSMSDGENFQSLISGLDSEVRAVHGEIEAARREIERANQNIEEMLRTQHRQTNELGAVKQQLNALQHGQEALRANLMHQLNEHNQRLTDTVKILILLKKQQEQLIQAQREEAARKRLEQQKTQFLIRINGLLGVINDGPVRYLFATKAIEACTARDIRSDTFQGATDQKTIADMLANLAAAKQSATAEDRAEADRFVRIKDLVLDIRHRREIYNMETAAAKTVHASLVEKRNRHEALIAELSGAEAPAALEHRHRVRNASAATALILVIASGAVVFLSSSFTSETLAQFVFGCLLVLSVITFVVSWFYSDMHRKRRLENNKQKLKRVVEKLEQLDTEFATRERQMQADVRIYVTDLAALHVATPELTGRMTLDAQLGVLLTAAQSAENAWRSQHVDARLLE
jgi:hypothetical protein